MTIKPELRARVIELHLRGMKRGGAGLASLYAMTSTLRNGTQEPHLYPGPFSYNQVIVYSITSFVLRYIVGKLNENVAPIPSTLFLPHILPR